MPTLEDAADDIEAVMDAAGVGRLRSSRAGGGRAVRRTDHILATMMFTDIVGSTVRASELGDARWRVLLDRHDDLLRDHVEAAGGRVLKMTGDGSLSIFDGPARLSSRCFGCDLDRGVAADRVVLATARRAPGLLRLIGRLSARG